MSFIYTSRSCGAYSVSKSFQCVLIYKPRLLSFFKALTGSLYWLNLSELMMDEDQLHVIFVDLKQGMFGCVVS